MKIKQILALVIAILVAIGITACSKDETSDTPSNTVTGGSVEDVFDLTQSSDNGEEATINSSLIDSSLIKFSLERVNNTQIGHPLMFPRTLMFFET